MPPAAAARDKENSIVPRAGATTRGEHKAAGSTRRPLQARPLSNNSAAGAAGGMEPAKAEPGSVPKRASQDSAKQPPTAQLRGVSWERDLDAYTRPQGSSPSAARSLRERLAEGVRQASASPEAWWALLQQEEAALAAAGSGTATLGGAARGGVALFDLYQWATKLVPRQANCSNEAYLKIWLGYARQQWYKNQDDARDTFKTLRSQHIGDRSALLYYEWAALEQLAGHASKAAAVLSKGLREAAAPAGLLEEMQADVQAGKFVFRPPWASAGVSGAGSHTGHSSGSTYAAFVTPGALDHRRSAATPALDGNLGGGGGTETLVLGSAMPAALSQGGSSLQAQPSNGGSKGAAASGAAGAELDTVIIQPRPPRQGSGTGSLADAYTSNRTSHTFGSTSTGSGGESTAPLRMSTPRAGLSGHSNSTTGSIGEEATVCLRKSGGGSGGAKGGGPGSGGRGDSSAGLGQGSRDDTIIVNRPGLLKPARASGAAEGGAGGRDPALPKPRRIGMLGLGRAMRVTPGTAAPSSAAAADAAAAAPAPAAGCSTAEDAVDALRKRKAEAEAAHSPRPPTATAAGDNKRRSPENGDTSQPPAKATPGGEAAPAPAARPRQLPPVPRFDGSQPAAAPSSAAAGAAAAAAVAAPPSSSDAAPAKPATPVPARPATGGAVPGAAQPRQQVVLGAEEGPGGVGGSDDEDETVPAVMSKLALKIQKGRQSLAPGKILMRADGAVVGHGEATSTSLDSQEEAGDDAPTAAVARPPPAAPAAVAGDDPEATRPLLRPASQGARASPPRAAAAPARQVQIDSAGNVKLQQVQQPAAHPQPAALKRMPVPPPPPPSELPGDPPAARVPMGPPAPMPPRHLRPAPQQQQQQQQQPALVEPMHSAPAAAATAAAPAAAQQPRRRVVEDENTVVVKGIAYTKLECVGRGGSSKVYKVMAPNRKIFALKRIRLSGRDSEAATGFLDEITLLNKLKGRSNIIQLIDSEVHRHEGLIYMVLECGDIDLARLLQKHEKARQEHVNADELDENFIRLYWEQMLQAVYSIHEERIVHSDLKPANFLMVEGQLKLIDFGIAKAIQADTTSIARESQVGTLNYMSPEAILGGQNNIRGGPPMKVGRPSDVWSLGCILYQMVYGHTPFSHLPFIPKMHAIIDPNHRIAFPPIRNAALLDVMQRCLDRNPRSRITMLELLEHPFLRPTQPALASAGSAGGTGSGEVRMSKEQLTKLLLQVSQAGVENSEVGKLSEELFRQMSNGLSPNVLAMKSAGSTGAPAGSSKVSPEQPAAAAPAAAPAARQPLQQQQQRVTRAEPASVAEAAAQAAAARAEQRAAAVAAVDARPRGADGATACGRAPLMPISQSAIAHQAAALRKVEAPAAGARATAPAPPEGGLEAALRKGLERFKFDDTQGATGHGGDDTTGDF